MRTFLALRSSGLELLRALERLRLLRPGGGPFLVGGMDYLAKMATDVDDLIRGEAAGGPTGRGMVDSLGFEFGGRNPFLLPLRPGGRGREETGRKGPSGREAADAGPRRGELSADTGLAEALFELATVNDEEWGGIRSGHALLLREAGPPRSGVSRWGIDRWKRRPWEPLNIISRGRARMEPGDIPCRGNGGDDDGGGRRRRGGDRETPAANETGPVETCDSDGGSSETSGLAALIALEKERIFSQGRGSGIPCSAALARPREGAAAAVVEHEGADIGI